MGQAQARLTHTFAPEETAGSAALHLYAAAEACFLRAEPCSPRAGASDFCFWWWPWYPPAWPPLPLELTSAFAPAEESVTWIERRVVSPDCRVLSRKIVSISLVYFGNVTRNDVEERVRVKI